MENDFYNDKVQYGRTVIEYRYSFSKRKQLAISVYPDRRVVAIAPESSHPDQIREKIKKRGAWILKQKRFFEQFLPVIKPRRFISGESHLYLGKQYRLKVRKGEDNQVKLIGGYFQVLIDGEKNSEKVKILMDSWYLEHAEAVYSQQIETCLKAFVKHKIKKPKFRIRFLKSRWGNCSKSGILTLNRDLVKTPKKCIQYVVTHELCHLIEPNHSPKFYNLMDKILPEWSILKEQLNFFGNIVH